MSAVAFSEDLVCAECLLEAGGGCDCGAPFESLRKIHAELHSNPDVQEFVADCAQFKRNGRTLQ